MKHLAAAILMAILVIFGLTACEGDSGTTSDYDGPNGVIFMPIQGNPVGIPIFY
ncbi:hypothetical protein 40AC_41 [Mycobacterium phage 40AC]|uniref:Lipoprotein n=1 Tax=Mycobacterium phage 40AC TaxID=1458717 RepID=W8EHK1_9CAUD|nr:hypothetical protein ST40AC_41 [Mycobacterium phage 40AC]AHJ86405.1 hypothetical protein 40AC_41 [Mycobacterium phage 40AC]